MIWARRASLAILVGALAGSAATVFLFTLQWVTAIRQAFSAIIYALPLAGFLIGWLYHKYGQEVRPGTNLILAQIHQPDRPIPPRMAPLILFSTLITHLFGGSAGREGTAVQMGGSLGDWIAQKFSATLNERRVLLMAGMGAGFGAAVGAPIAGAVFGIEVIRTRGRFRVAAVFECAIAAAVAYATTRVLRAPHTLYPVNVVPPLEWRLVLALIAAGVGFGLTARFFILLTHHFERVLAAIIKHPVYRPTVAGLLIVLLYAALGSFRFAGLGLEVIQSALESPADWRDPLIKLFFTVLTIGGGFKGGEFIPLVFIGTTLGSALGAAWLPESFTLFAAVGFSAVFGAAAQTPIACAIMGAEIFGRGMLVYALLGGVVAYFVAGPKSIYRHN